MSKHTQEWYGDSFRARLQSHSNEWYTPTRYIEAARTLFGGVIDLDPASCALANQVVQARRYYTKEQDGLKEDWTARSLFLNPPYGKTGAVSNQQIWSCKLIAEYEAGRVGEAVLLVNASTDTGWFQRLWEYPICFVHHRVNFYRLEGGCSGATHATVFVYFGQHEARFHALFVPFGPIVKPVSAPLVSLWTDEGVHA